MLLFARRFRLACICFALSLALANAAAAQNVKVEAADPPSGEQDTTALEVTIKGNGFANGANAQFFMTGTTNPGGVTVRSTRFVNNKTLVATIDIASDAQISNFDVVVKNSNGRTGKGTEIFSVTEKGSGGGNTVTGCSLQPLPAGISLVGALNSVGPNGSALYGPVMGTALGATPFELGGRSVLLVAVGAAQSATLEIFFLDAATGAVLDGTRIGDAAEPQPHITVPIADSMAGGSTVVAGDLNGDGIPDFAFSMKPGLVATVVGAVNPETGVMSYQLFPVTTPPSSGGFGEGVALGDFDGSGWDTLAVGAPGADKLYLFKFTGSGFVTTMVLSNPIPNATKGKNSHSARFGGRIVIADVTADSRLDLVVSASASVIGNNSNAGRIFVFPGPIVASNYLTLTAGNLSFKDDWFGYRLAAGDVDGNGIGDVLVTTLWNNGNARAHLHYGAVSGGQAADVVLRPDAGDDTGWAVGSPAIGDLNADGKAEVLIGTPNATCGGVTYLHASSSGLPLGSRLKLHPPVVSGNQRSEYQAFGWSVATGPGTQLFFVADKGMDVVTGTGSSTGSGQVYIYRYGANLQ